MTSYCGSQSGSPMCPALGKGTAKQQTLLSVLIVLILLFVLFPSATAQTSGHGTFSVAGSEQYYCPPQAPTKTQGPLSICTGRISDGGTVTITIHANPDWSTNASYSQGCIGACVAQGLTSALNVSASPVTASYLNGVVTITAKAKGSQSNYSVTSSSSTALPQYFSHASFSISPASFTLTGGTDIPPAAPSGLSATPGASGLSVALSWIDNANNENNYTVERCTGSGCSTFSPLTTTLPPNTTNYTDSTTSPSTTYRYRVQATNTAGGSGYATTSDVTTPSVPAAPTNFNATPSADGRNVTVTWTDNATNETGYSGNYCPGGSPTGCPIWQNVGTYPANTTTYTMSGLSPGSTNMFEVHAFNAVGESTHVGHVDVTQPNYPSVPSITSAVSGPDGATATITWSDVATETAYYLERCTGTNCNSGFTVIGNNLPANTTTFNDSGLTSGTTYGYRVRAYNAVGYSGYSTIAYLTPTMQPPAAPTALTATSAGNGQSVNLSWTDNASNETSYELQRCTGTGCTPANYQALSANTVSQTDSPTTPSTLYGYAVCAVNAGGASCSSTVYIATNSGVATVHYYISDHLGSTSLVVSSSGTVEEEEMYYPYGGERWTSGSDSNHYKFTGKERDTETGLDYFGARYYGSNMGRWMNPDWADKPTTVPYAQFGDPQSLNLYGYVKNNPLGGVDSDGHCGGPPPEQPCPANPPQKQAQNLPEHGEGSQANLNRRAEIAAAAQAHEGDTSMPYTPNHATCNLFCQKAVTEAGAPKPEVLKADGKMGAPSAAELSGDRIPHGWRLLKKGESPMPGDIAARKENFVDATGHSGIVVSVKNGIVTVMAAHQKVIGKDMSFQSGGHNRFLRYTGE